MTTDAIDVLPNSKIKAKTLDIEQLRIMINSVYGSNAETTDYPSDGGARFGRLHSAINLRTLHYHNDPKADPQLAPPYDKGSKFQTDRLRQVNVRLLAKQTENAPLIKVDPGSSKEKIKERADQFETVMNRILDLVQARQRLNIQTNLHYHANVHSAGILTWRMAPDVWPKVPDYLYSDTPGGDYNDYVLPDDEVAEGEDAPATPRYRETDAALQTRYTHSKVGSGAPWYMETPHPNQFAMIEDRTQLNGMGVAFLRRKIPVMDYFKEVYKKDKLCLSLHDKDPRILIYEEKDAPENWTPSGSNNHPWGKYVYTVEVWTRDEFYEVATCEENWDGFEIIKSGPHPYGMCPFALAPGHENPEADPLWRWEPLLAGLYRIKPYYDRARTLADIIAEMIALPLWYIELPNGKTMIVDGKPVFLTRNALAAQVLPPGAKLVKVEYELNPAVMGWINSLREELDAAAPTTGATEISAGTEPWAIRLQQAEANIEIKPSVQHVASAIQTMARNMAYVMSLSAEEGGFGEEIVVYGKTTDGKLDKDTIIGINPEDIPSMEIYVNIDPHSASERITLEQHGLQMMKDPNSLMTRRRFAEDFSGIQDASRAILEADAEDIWLHHLKPGVLAQELARSYANFIVLGPDGTFIGMDGNAIAPENVLLRNAGNGAPPPILPPQPTPPGGDPEVSAAVPQVPAEATQVAGAPLGGNLQAPGTISIPPMAR